VILNFAGSEGHARGCAEAIAGITGLSMLGWLPRDSKLQIPERHLVWCRERTSRSNVPHRRHRRRGYERFDLGAIMEIAQTAGDLPEIPRTAARRESSIQRPVIAVARDDAFASNYPKTLNC